MIDTIRAQCHVVCSGGFIAYYQDSILYAADPAAMFSRAIAILIAGDNSLLICPVDLTRPDAPQTFTFRRLPRQMVTDRATGALFFQKCYFEIKDGDLKGRYQISEDRITNDTFPNARAYTRCLLGR